jgi:hypothetical protein
MKSIENSFNIILSFVPNNNKVLFSFIKLLEYSIETEDVSSNNLELITLSILFKGLLALVSKIFYAI